MDKETEIKIDLDELYNSLTKKEKIKMNLMSIWTIIRYPFLLIKYKIEEWKLKK